MINIFPIDKSEGEFKGFGLWFWIGTREDMYFTVLELSRKHNPNRMKRFCIHILFIKWHISIEIPYKNVGYNFYGQKMKVK